MPLAVFRWLAVERALALVYRNRPIATRRTSRWTGNMIVKDVRIRSEESAWRGRAGVRGRVRWRHIDSCGAIRRPRPTIRHRRVRVVRPQLEVLAGNLTDPLDRPCGAASRIPAQRSHTRAGTSSWICTAIRNGRVSSSTAWAKTRVMSSFVRGFVTWNAVACSVHLYEHRLWWCSRVVIKRQPCRVPSPRLAGGPAGHINCCGSERRQEAPNTNGRVI